MLKLVVFHLPNVLIFGSYILFFWSNEGSEPVHIHVAVKRPSRVSAKFWILEDGSCKLANNHADIRILPGRYGAGIQDCGRRNKIL